MVLLLLQLIPNQITKRWTPTDAAPSKPKTMDEDGNSEESDTSLCGKDAWYMHPLTQLIALWQFITVLLFSCIEFQYNSTLGHQLDADGIAQVTANLASVASVGQTLVNLLVTPFLLQVSWLSSSLLTALLTSLLSFSSTLLSSYHSSSSHSQSTLLSSSHHSLPPTFPCFIPPTPATQRLGVWAALLVTPAAYVLGEALVMSSQVRQLSLFLRTLTLRTPYAHPAHYLRTPHPH